MPLAFLETGDLLFTQIGSAGDAISAVTEGYRCARVNHVGVAATTAEGVFVLEAYPPEVRLTAISVYLRRSADRSGKPRCMVGRLRPEYRPLIPEAMAHGFTRREIPYDCLYMPDEAALYCSELVVDMFKHANGGVPFFPEHHMSFRHRDTGEICPAWIDYYASFGLAVPEREPGSNPGDISKDPRLEIALVLGDITGYVGD